MPKESNSQHTGEKLSRKIELIAIRALQIIGLRHNRKHGHVPTQIVRTMGANWAIWLVEFFHWRNRQGSELETIGPPFLVRMWEYWEADPYDHDWDKDFKEEMRKEGRARCSSVVQAMVDYNFEGPKRPERTDDDMAVAKHASGPPVAQPALPLAQHEKLTIPPDWLPGIPEEQVRELCNRGLRFVRVVDKNVRPLDITVRDAARRIWEKENFPLVGAWSPLAKEENNGSSSS